MYNDKAWIEKWGKHAQQYERSSTQVEYVTSIVELDFCLMCKVVESFGTG